MSLGLIFLAKNKFRHARVAIGASLAILLLFSNSLIADWIGNGLEREFPSRFATDYPQADAIVVLGGSVSGPVPPRKEVEELGGARILGATRLYLAGKAPILLVSSGGEYTGSAGDIRTDGLDMAELAQEYGVKKDAILIENKARTTAENAIYSAQMLSKRGVKKILLVTSAAHMKRALRLYEKQGLTVIPVATSHEIVNGRSAQDYLPRSLTLYRSTSYLKEYFGRWLGR